jgi:DNA modification methylase
MKTQHKVIFGDCRSMEELEDESVHLMVTSPPYYNAPFDYPGLFKSYDEFLRLIEDVSRNLYRVIAPGRIAVYITDDMLVDGEKFPVVADITKIMLKKGFRYRDRIVWKKPEGYTRISRRSGVLLQHPYPMYFYPDNLQESLLIFQKGEFDYSQIKTMGEEVREASEININEFNKNKWNLTVWDIVNVLPSPGRLEEGVAAFPEEIPRRFIKLFSFVGETVLDPFLGSGTTMKVAKELRRNSIGYELDVELEPIIAKKTGYGQTTFSEDRVQFFKRADAKKLRTFLQERVKNQKSVTRPTVT